MTQLQCKANFIGLSNKSKQDPDVFIFKDPTKRPHPEFTISRTKDGNKLSTYGDDTWDLRPYQLAGASRSAKLHFKFAEGNHKGEAKWLMFICMFIADTGGATGMSVATLLNYLKTIRALSKYSQENDINITDLISNEEEIVKFTSKTLSANILQGLSSLLGIFLSLPIVIPEFKVEKSVKFDIILSKIKYISDTQQYPVIPPRIYSNLINNIDLLISEFFNCRNEIFNFLKKITSYKYYGKSRSLQRKLGCRSGEYEPNFKAASEIFGLDYLFFRYHVKDLRSLSKFLTRMQHGCRTLIYIYTGMRHSEGLSLKMECLHISGEENNKTYKIKGETSKFIGQRKATSWITSSDIEKAYYLANKLAEIIGKHAGIPLSDTPLFISISYLGLFNNRSHDGIQVITSSTSTIDEEIYSLMSSNDFKILGEDIQHLEMVNPFRAWQSEQAFKIGSIWRFTAHQFRRSLAFYVAQSAHVSLPSLKRQLKHISRQMTIYYCQSKVTHDEFNYDEHISQLISREKPGFDAMAYLHHILHSEEKLFGAHGKFVENNLKIKSPKLLLDNERDELTKRFKRGEIAYKETPLGACVTTSPCNKRAFRIITACVNCEKSVIKPSKLISTIARQSTLVQELKDLNYDSVEYRTELAELNALEMLHSQIIAKSN